MKSNQALLNCFFPALIIACVFPIEFRAQSKSFYVSPLGSDVNGGTGISDALATVTKGVNLAQPGDTVYLMPGTLKEKISIVSKKGIPENPVYIRGLYTPEEMRPVIDGAAAEPTLNAQNLWMIISDSQWLEFSNIIFKNGWTDPVQITNSSYINFSKCTFYGGRKVILATGEDTHHLLVENCYWDQGGEALWKYSEPGGIEAAWATLHDGAMSYYNGSLIDFGGTGGSVVIRNNYIVNAFNGIRWSAQQNYDSNVEIYGNNVEKIRDNDFEPENFSFNLFIHHNYSHNIHKTMSVDNVNGGFIYYFGNRITSANDSWSNQICTGFWKVYGTERNLSFPMYAFNNSFCGVGKVMGSMNGKALNFKHFNNVYYFTGSRTWNLDQWDNSDEFDYDISSKQWPSNIVNNGQEKNGRIADAMFKDPTLFDLSLKDGSPAADAGKINSFPELGWTQTYSGTAPDAGAYENGRPVQGPAFRFITSPELKINYKEKPRITQAEIAGRSLRLFFSVQIDPASVSTASIQIISGGIRTAVTRVDFKHDFYTLEIQTASDLNADGLSLGFSPMPKGMNGETATMWASALGDIRNSVFTAVNLPGTEQSLPVSLSLDVYPNPFNPGTTIKFSIPAYHDVGTPHGASLSTRLEIYDILGREVANLLNENKSPGTYEVKFNGAKYSSGIYFVVLSYGNSVLTSKLLLLK